MVNNASREPTPEEMHALDQARDMARAGIPIFVCPPNPYRPGKYFLRAEWQHAVPDPTVLDQWKPGWGVGAVGGGTADFLDADPRNGSDESVQILKNEGHWPLTFGTQSTPSGGTHHIISRTGERKETGFMPGLDFQAGAEDGGRAFIWLAPTVGRSRVTGELVPYRWVEAPDLEALHEWAGSDSSTEMIVSRVYAHRALKGSKPVSALPAPAGPTDHLFATPGEIVAQRADGAGARTFTSEQVEAFVRPALDRLAAARVGEIEECGMAATLAIEHFVPTFFTAEQAYARITDALGHTAYDPNGPSDWTADKFLARLDGRRPVIDSWRAELRTPATTSDQGCVPDGLSPVDALLAEMLTLGEVKERPAPHYLIKNLLTLDSEAWLIGAPGSRKSFVALDMALHVATGRPWQGLRVAQHDVVIIAAEGAASLGKRITAWERTHGALPGNVHVLPRPVQAANAAAWDVLVQACTRLAPGLVIVDTQARVTVGLEENSATEMGHYIAAVGAVRRATGACVLTVHHTGRRGGDARGSSAIDGAQDTELKVVKGDGLRGELHIEKQKDLEERAPITLIFTSVNVGVDEDGEPITSLVLAGEDVWRQAEAQLPEVEEWESGHAVAIVQLFKVLRDQGGSIGLTKTEARNALVERFYSGNIKALSKSTYYTAWTRAREKVSTSGELVMVNVSGEKWTVDPVALATLAPRPDMP